VTRGTLLPQKMSFSTDQGIPYLWYGPETFSSLFRPVLNT